MQPNVVLHPCGAAADRLRVWLGIFGKTASPASLSWRLDGVLVEPSTVVRPLESVRQGTYLSGSPPRTFTGVFDFVLPPAAQGRAHVVEAMIPGEPTPASLTTSPVPAQVGTDWSQPFNVLTMSCFDTATDRGKARQVLSSLPQHLVPHLTLLTGDQVYLDAPTPENLPNDDVALAEVLEQKYIHNWRTPGVFSHVLDMAPTVCCPDDHEYWNNYPTRFAFAGNTWQAKGRQRWMAIGKRLYQCFQHTNAVPFGHPIRVDVSPLSFLVVDTRSFRDDGGNNNTLHGNALAAVKQWAKSLKSSGHIGVFVSGQSLMEDAKGWFGARLKDATLANFDDYAPIMEALHEAMRDGSDILLVTGDVHWSHVAQLEPVDALVNGSRAFEVICSPSSLLNSIFKATKPPPIHEWAGSKRQTGMRLPTRMGKDLKGDHACILSFRRIGLRSAPSVELKVTFVPLSPGEPPYELGSTLVLRRR